MEGLDDLNKLGIGLIFSYTLGLVLDVLESPYSRFWLWLYPKLWKTYKKRKTNDQLWQWIRDLPLIDRTLYTKMMAEKILFSSLSIGTLLMCIVPPSECARTLFSSLSICTLFRCIFSPTDLPGLRRALVVCCTVCTFRLVYVPYQQIAFIKYVAPPRIDLRHNPNSIRLC